jgi:hypothetical protein
MFGHAFELVLSLVLKEGVVTTGFTLRSKVVAIGKKSMACKSFWKMDKR